MKTAHAYFLQNSGLGSHAQLSWVVGMKCCTTEEVSYRGRGAVYE
ncbi:hypothetical protein BFJ70_g859 [Fusarium oxysporum]|uniref:Uncharacterized protein n=2 Tax=Fusarium oxysporum TaxID=5507 RepID=A0A420R467_FUSOX|nr:hypothetical protein BFJ65_g17181 [Fusarium oxysporum f. sp. cepae]RKL11810.1 hypothetical protein BFJ71_g291 [Fusarium oxysporum]RKK46777.1 hypothetical protein BFJ66_g8351 [Fusarium oxysporum f. sp. cepae]RKK49193.1 hypothetical protein BFJ67_g6958 [Fusarium oxysporum f. sp. cepae]RKL19136.1 hypothetical protein BFJ68_g3411 [Fusarium oxysporum]